jgi:hypothetical protein
MVPCSLQYAHHPSVSTDGWHSGMLHEDHGWVPEEGCFSTTERLEQEATLLPAVYSVSTTRLKIWCPPVWCSGGSYVCLAIYCLEHPHSKVQPTTDYLRDLMEQLHEIDHYACQYLTVARGWRPAMSAQPTQPHSRIYTSSSCTAGIEGTCLSCKPSWEGSHPVQLCSLRNPASFQFEDSGGSPGQTGSVSGGYLGPPASRKEQCHIKYVWSEHMHMPFFHGIFQLHPPSHHSLNFLRVTKPSQRRMGTHKKLLNWLCCIKVIEKFSSVLVLTVNLEAAYSSHVKNYPWRRKCCELVYLLVQYKT